MNLWEKIRNRMQSWAVWTTLTALVAFVTKQWFGWEIPGWDDFVTLLMAVLVAFGIINNPDNKGEF